MLMIYKCFILSYICYVVAARTFDLDIIETNLESVLLTDTRTENAPTLNESPNIIFKDISDLIIYYNPKDNTTITAMAPRPTYSTPNGTLRLPFIGGPCDCFGGMCACCLGVRVPIVNARRTVCANISYIPHEFALNLAIVSNNNTLLNQTISAKNPPALCMPIPIPIMWVPTIGLCVHVYDIHTYGANIHVCISFETRVDSQGVLILQFDCVDLGTEGVHLTKPEDQQSMGPCPCDNPATEPDGPEQVNVDVYDPIVEKLANHTTLPEVDMSEINVDQ